MREKEKCILAPLYWKIFYNLSFIDDCNLYELPFLVFLCNETVCIINVWIYLRLSLGYIPILFIDTALVSREMTGDNVKKSLKRTWSSFLMLLLFVFSVDFCLTFYEQSTTFLTRTSYELSEPQIKKLNEWINK